MECLLKSRAYCDILVAQQPTRTSFPFLSFSLPTSAAPGIQFPRKIILPAQRPSRLQEEGMTNLVTVKDRGKMGVGTGSSDKAFKLT